MIFTYLSQWAFFSHFAQKKRNLIETTMIFEISTFAWHGGAREFTRFCLQSAKKKYPLHLFPKCPTLIY